MAIGIKGNIKGNVGDDQNRSDPRKVQQRYGFHSTSQCVCPSVILLVYRLYYIIIVVIGDGNEGNAV